MGRDTNIEWCDSTINGSSFIGSAVHHPWGRCQPAMTRVGKEKAGRSLDGREWNEMPRLSIPNDQTEQRP